MLRRWALHGLRSLVIPFMSAMIKHARSLPPSRFARVRKHHVRLFGQRIQQRVPIIDIMVKFGDGPRVTWAALHS
jgi:hypothetical protein